MYCGDRLHRAAVWLRTRSFAKPGVPSGAGGGQGSDAIETMEAAVTPSLFPFLRVAREYNVPYPVVLWFADVLERPSPVDSPMPYHVARDFPSGSISDQEPWATATQAAWTAERSRRLSSAASADDGQ
jgi:hypothetical protein